MVLGTYIPVRALDQCDNKRPYNIVTWACISADCGSHEYYLARNQWKPVATNDWCGQVHRTLSRCGVCVTGYRFHGTVV